MPPASARALSACCERVSLGCQLGSSPGCLIWAGVCSWAGCAMPGPASTLCRDHSTPSGSPGSQQVPCGTRTPGTQPRRTLAALDASGRGLRASVCAPGTSVCTGPSLPSSSSSHQTQESARALTWRSVSSHTCRAAQVGARKSRLVAPGPWITQQSGARLPRQRSLTARACAPRCKLAGQRGLAKGGPSSAPHCRSCCPGAASWSAVPGRPTP